MGTQFNFDYICQLQKSSSEPTETKPYLVYKDPVLSEASRLDLVDDNDKRKALALYSSVIDINTGIDGDAAELAQASRIIHQALILRAKVHSSMNNYTHAANDLERAIVLRPKYLDSYIQLSSVERNRKQFGRKEVVLRLGLR